MKSDSFVAGIHKLEVNISLSSSLFNLIMNNQLERIRYVLCSYLRTRLKKVIVSL